MQAIDITDYDYTLIADKKKEEKKKTIFILSTLTFEQDTYIENEISRGTPDGDIAAAVLHMGIRGVRNFTLNGKLVIPERDEESQITYPGDVRPWKNKFLSQIYVQDRSELQLEIRFRKSLREKERKN